MMQSEVLARHKIGVLCGGFSKEREVSLRSGKNVYESLQRSGYDSVSIDMGRNAAEQIKAAGITFAYIALHGSYGEDGCVQGLLEIMGIPYTGSGVLASALGMDKIATKRVLESAGIATPAYKVVHIGSAESARDCESELGFPLVVKPSSEGSSISISIAHDLQSLAPALETVCRDYGSALVEQYIAGDEVTTGVLGYGDCAEALPVLGLIPDNAFYDYEAKYTKGKTRFVLPAALEPEVYARVQQSAVDVHCVVGCHGVSRVDAMVDGTGKPWIIEINTAPGMTETSDLPAQAAANGMDFDELVKKIMLYVLEKK